MRNVLCFETQTLSKSNGAIHDNIHLCLCFSQYSNEEKQLETLLLLCCYRKVLDFTDQCSVLLAHLKNRVQTIQKHYQHKTLVKKANKTNEWNFSTDQIKKHNKHQHNTDKGGQAMGVELRHAQRWAGEASIQMKKASSNSGYEAESKAF